MTRITLEDEEEDINDDDHELTSDPKGPPFGIVLNGHSLVSEN